MSLYLYEIQTEQTTPDKKSVKFIYHINAVHYVLSGKGYYNGKLLQKGDGFVCFKNTAVDYYPDPKDPWEYVWACFAGDSPDCKTVPCAPDTFCFKFKDDSIFEKTVDFIESSRNELHENPSFASACASLLFSRHITSDANSSPCPMPRKHAELAKKYILSNFHKSLTPAEVAKALNFSRAYLRNIFYDAYGISPRDFLISTRLKRAKELLELENISITEVANSTGYSDVLQFSKIFKKHTGVSPKEYRKNNV